jgi:hypothetical protein
METATFQEQAKLTFRIHLLSSGPPLPAQRTLHEVQQPEIQNMHKAIKVEFEYYVGCESQGGKTALKVPCRRGILEQ